MHEHFLKLKSNLELDPTFAELIITRHNAIRTYLQNNLPNFKDSKLIGSLQRQTRINPGNGNFDIDIIVIMGEIHRWVSFGGITPQVALNTLHATVNKSDRYGAMDPVQDPPTVTLTYKDRVEVQLVPAYIDMIGSDANGNYLGEAGRGYWVVKNRSWEMADYDHEAEYISQQNELSDGHLVPTIKMLKAIKRIHFPELDSFPLEIMAARIIPISVFAKQAQEMPIHYHNLIHEFFLKAQVILNQPIRIPDSKSQPIILPDALRISLRESFDTIAKFIAYIHGRTNQDDKIKAWRDLFGEHFPVIIN
ncbi:hypothetical protein A3F52_00860 [Candidatus Uhrbacteria bacterium RIFCSPHIGHO2_12_FULL_47_11]|nr:MAG: hypothetical protein A3F52_00860 [Candidatus Uhrbacteria bacterium RIFCSPHIGHO2_12_FULL_47_11]